MINKGVTWRDVTWLLTKSGDHIEVTNLRVQINRASLRFLWAKPEWDSHIGGHNILFPRDANMDIHTHKNIGRCAADLKWPNIPGGSIKSSADEADGLESCSSTLSICTHMHDISDGSIRHSHSCRFWPNIMGNYHQCDWSKMWTLPLGLFVAFTICSL